MKPVPPQWIRLPALKLSLPPPETFHTLNTVVLVGQNPRPACCGTPSRRFRDYDSEPGLVPKNFGNRGGRGRQVKTCAAKYNPKSHRKKRSRILRCASHCASILRSRGRLPSSLKDGLLAARPSCAVAPVGIASA